MAKKKIPSKEALAARQIIAANLQRIMDSRSDLATRPKLAGKAGVGQRTVNRLCNEETDAQVDTLIEIAKAAKCQPWELLMPDFQPGKKRSEEESLENQLLEIFRRLPDPGMVELIATANRLYSLSHPTQQLEKVTVDIDSVQQPVSTLLPSNTPILKSVQGSVGKILSGNIKGKNNGEKSTKQTLGKDSKSESSLHKRSSKKSK